MRFNILGNSDIAVSALGLGCWSFGGGAYWGHTSQKDVEAVVRSALDSGLNYFDTAEVYNGGESERALGLALGEHRAEAIIGTKVSTSACGPSALRNHCVASLKRLGTDYIDIYMLHWPINKKALEHFSDDPELLKTLPTTEEVFTGLLQLKKEGLIRNIGVSNHGVQQMDQALDSEILVNELPYNLVSRGIETDILPYCAKKRIGVIAYMAMQQGLLAGIYPTPESVPPAQAHSRHFHYSRGGEQSRHGEDGAEREIFTLIGEARKLADQLGVTLPVLSLAWAMSNKDIACTLVGVRSVEKIKMNISAAEFALPEDARRMLDSLSLSVLEKLGPNPDYYENRKSSRIF
ncbi:MAG: aldo/keto reductase [Treponemataceae bacterium]